LAYTETVCFATYRIRVGTCSRSIACFFLLFATSSTEIRGIHFLQDAVGLELSITGSICGKLEVGKVLDEGIIPPTVAFD